MGDLTARRVEALKKKGRYLDGRGLALQVNANGAKSWTFLFMLNGRPRQMGLGPLEMLSLADARDAAFEARKLVKAGIDPIEQRRAERMKARQGLSFKECAERYITARSPMWKDSGKSKRQWESSLEAYVYPKIGSLPAAIVSTAHVLEILEPIWTEKLETASRVRARVEQVLDYAKHLGVREGDNAAAWRGNLKHLLPSHRKIRAVEHHAALDYREVPAFLVSLRGQAGVAARALEFTILCATRTNETINAKWPEFDLAAKVWTIPAERMKTGREHRVPLPARAVEILKSLPREKGNEEGYVFIGMRAGAPLSNMALLATLKRMKRSDIATHGFRASFRTWVSETTAYPTDIAEAALAHVIKDRTAAAYLRGDLFDKRRRLIADWARYCATVPKLKRKADNVVPMRAGA